MKKRLFSLAALSFALCLLLSGCSFDFLTADKLLHPPRSSGDEDLQDAFLASFDKVKSSDIILKPPVGGDYRSAYVKYDMDGDGEDEALVFYVLKADKTTCNINYLDYQDGGWRSLATVKGLGNEVADLVFLQMDQDAVPEMMITWSTKDSVEKKLAIYHYDETSVSMLNTIATATAQVSHPVDIDGDHFMEVFYAGPVDVAPKRGQEGRIIKLKEGKIIQLSSVRLDSRISTYTDIFVQNKTEELPLILYLDASKGDKGMLTEILYWDESRNALNLAFYDAQKEEATQVNRDQLVATKDIDQDGMYEVPASLPLKGSRTEDSNASAMESSESTAYSSVSRSADISTEKIAMTAWLRFSLVNGEPALTDSVYSAIKFSDSYMFLFPSDWINTGQGRAERVNRVTIVANLSERRWSFYEYDPWDDVMGRELFSIITVPESEWAKQAQPDYTLLKTNGTLVYAARMGVGATAWKLTIEDVKGRIELIN